MDTWWVALWLGSCWKPEPVSPTRASYVTAPRSGRAEPPTHVTVCRDWQWSTVVLMDIPADLYVITKDHDLPEEGCVYVGEEAAQVMAGYAEEGTRFKARKWTWDDSTEDWERST